METREGGPVPCPTRGGSLPAPTPHQVLPPLDAAKGSEDSLVEIGPRFSLLPVKIFGRSSGGEARSARLREMTRDCPRL